MAQAPLTAAQLEHALRLVGLHGSVSAAARAANMPRCTLRDHYHRALQHQAHGRPPVRNPEYPARLNVHIDSGMVVVFSDAHYYPGEASTAHRALLRFIREFRPRGVVCNGDAFDGASISRHPRIGWDNKPSVNEEMGAVTLRMGEVEAVAGDYAWKVWPCGNHDARFETYLAANASQFEGLSGFALKDHFPSWSPCWRLDINAGEESHTIIKHRWKSGIHSNFNNSKDASTHFVTGHLHRAGVSRHTTARGTLYGVDTGCLANCIGDQFVDYTEDGVTGWRSAFAVLTYSDGMLLPPELVEVVSDGCVAFRGRLHHV